MSKSTLDPTRSARKKLGIASVLMTCSKDNVASSRSIEKNGGVLKNEIEIDGVPCYRYWINHM